MSFYSRLESTQIKRWPHSTLDLSVSGEFLHDFVSTVELRSKGPGRKGNPPIREMISGFISNFSIYFYIGYKGISVYRKNWAGFIKSLEAKSTVV